MEFCSTSPHVLRLIKRGCPMQPQSYHVVQCPHTDKRANGQERRRRRRTTNMMIRTNELMCARRERVCIYNKIFVCESCGKFARQSFLSLSLSLSLSLFLCITNKILVIIQCDSRSGAKEKQMCEMRDSGCATDLPFSCFLSPLIAGHT